MKQLKPFFLNIWFIIQTILIKQYRLGLLLYLSIPLTAQINIKGNVTVSNGQPVENASIRMKGSGEGTISDSTGYFSFTTGLKGKHILVISSIGLKELEQPVDIMDSAIRLPLVLEPEGKPLDPITVSAGSFEASDKAKGASLTPMDAVTVAGNGGDLANALRSFPGSQQIGDQEGLFVRGGTSDETRQFIDGALLPSPNFAPVPGIIQPARVNPFLFKGILFSTGGYSALYGGALSSALILESVDLPLQSSASLHIFPTAQGAGFQNLARNNNSSYGINANYGNYGFYNSIVKQQYDYFHAPEFFQTDGNFRIRTANNGMLKFYTNYSYNHTGYRMPDMDSLSLLSSFENKGTNIYSNLSYHQPLRNNWRIDAALAYNYYQQDIFNAIENQNDQPLFINDYPFNQKNNTIATVSNFIQARTVLTKMFRQNQAMRFGAEHFYNEEKYNYNDTLSHLKDNLTAVFAETDIQIAKNLAAKIGLRTEYSSLLDKINWVPRLSLAYRLPDGGQFNLAYGIFYQQPDPGYLIHNPRLNYEQSIQYVLNYHKKMSNRLLRVEAYYKKYENLVTTVPDTLNLGSGFAKGIEVFFRDKKTFKNFDYWISYTYIDTKRKYLNYPWLLNPNFAAPNTATVAVKRYFPALNFSANLSYVLAAGRPYYDIQNSETGKPEITDQGRTNMYNQLNLSFAWLFTLFNNWKSKDYSGVGFGVTNVLGTEQIFNYNYSYNGEHRVPVTLPATRSFYIGLFMTFGIDRREDFINDKL